MLICRDCGFIAEEAEWQETCAQMSLFGTDKLICPDCGSEDIVPAKKCAHCHHWYDEDTLCLTMDTDGNMIEVCSYCFDHYYFGEEEGETSV